MFKRRPCRAESMRVTSRPVIVAAAVAVLAAGSMAACGSGQPEAAGESATKTGLQSPAAQATQSALPALSDAVVTAREYIGALDRRDRAGFCRVLAPWVQARVGSLIKGSP